MKAAAATVVATKGASGRVGSVLDELVAQVVQGFHGAFEQRLEMLAGEVKRAIGAPMSNGSRATQGYASAANNSNGSANSAPRAD